MKQSFFLKTSYFLPFFFTFVGCSNPYSQFYNDFMGGKNILDEPTFIIPTDKPKLIAGVDVESDRKKMIEDNFWELGISSFNGTNVSQDLAIQHAQNIHAEAVIVYSRYSRTLSGIMPMTVPNTQTSTTYHSGNIYGSRGSSASFSGSSYTTTYGTSTTYMPYNIDKYDYFASFWIKCKPPRLGVVFDELTDELRRKIGSNKGAYIYAVVKGSPAFDSDLMSGDVIRRVNGIEVIDKYNLQNWLIQTHPSVIEFEIYRNEETISKKVQLQN